MIQSLESRVSSDRVSAPCHMENGLGGWIDYSVQTVGEGAMVKRRAGDEGRRDEDDKRAK